MSWTKKGLTEVENSAPKFGFPDREARFAFGDLEASDTGCAYFRFDPGQRSPFAHKHENAEEVYVVLSGGGRAKLDDEVVELQRLDALRVSPQVVRAFEAGNEGLELLAFGRRHEGDGELIHEDVFES
jgi:mannose-6-phosphate isomerase-like protein (cupin superfamily)